MFLDYQIKILIKTFFYFAIHRILMRAEKNYIGETIPIHCIELLGPTKLKGVRQNI